MIPLELAAALTAVLVAGCVIARVEKPAPLSVAREQQSRREWIMSQADPAYPTFEEYERTR